jgi:hypothetical protein
MERKANAVGASVDDRATLTAMTIRRWAGVAALAVAAGFAAGCAAGPPSSGAKAPAEPEPSTIEEAQAELARARAELGLPRSDAQTKDATGTSAATTPPDQLDLRKSEEPDGDRDATRREAGQGAGCGSACKAIASMRRAVDAICRMAGESDPRCSDARKTLADSAARVGACGC